jgi:hypothetical protein
MIGGEEEKGKKSDLERRRGEGKQRGLVQSCLPLRAAFLAVSSGGVWLMPKISTGKCR